MHTAKVEIYFVPHIQNVENGWSNPLINVLPGMFHLLLSNPKPLGSSSAQTHLHHTHTRTASLDLSQFDFTLLSKSSSEMCLVSQELQFQINNSIQHLTIDHKHFLLI